MGEERERVVFFNVQPKVVLRTQSSRWKGGVREVAHEMDKGNAKRAVGTWVSMDATNVTTHEHYEDPT